MWKSAVNTNTHAKSYICNSDGYCAAHQTHPLELGRGEGLTWLFLAYTNVNHYNMVLTNLEYVIFILPSNSI